MNAPSLELSRTNTPRLSAGLREHTDAKLRKGRAQYAQNLPKAVDRPASLFNNGPPQAAQSGRRVAEAVNARVVDSLNQENGRLRSLLNQKEQELHAVCQKREELEDYVGLLKSQSSQEAELVQSRVLQKIKAQREQAQASEYLKEKQMQELIGKLENAENELEAFREAFEEEVEHLTEDLDKANAVASSYKAQDSEKSQELEKLRQELVTKDRNIESFFIRIQEKDRDINEIKLYLRDSEQRITDLQHLLESRDAELEETINENRKIKEHLDELMQSPDRKLQKEETKIATLDDDDRSKYEWTINELRKQLASQSALHTNGALGKKSNLKSDKGSNHDDLILQYSEPHKTVTKEDKSEQCTQLENYFKNLIEYILKENCCLENTYDYSLGELHSLLIRFVRELREEQGKLMQENEKLHQKVDSYRSKLTDESQRDSVGKLSNQIKLLKDDNENLRNIIHSQKGEIISMSQRSTAKSGLPKSLQHKSSQATQTGASVAKQRDAGGQTERPRVAEFCAMANDDAGLEKARTLEKAAKDARHDAAVKAKLVRELEAQKTLLEEEITRLKSQTEADSEGRRKGDLLEKKINLLHQDLAAKDKKNIELFELIKKLRAENENLNETIKINSDKLFPSKLTSKRTPSASKPLALSKQAKVVSIDIDSHVNKVNDEVREAQAELSDLYKKVVFSKKVDQFYAEKGILYQSLDSQLKRNKNLVKENSFLREYLENMSNVPRTVELELLSSEETEALLDQIIHMATNSNSMKRRLLESDDFKELCGSVLKQRGFNHRETRY